MGLIKAAIYKFKHNLSKRFFGCNIGPGSLFPVSIFEFLKLIILSYSIKRTDKERVIFVMTSKAEERVLTPLLSRAHLYFEEVYIIVDKKVNCNRETIIIARQDFIKLYSLVRASINLTVINCLDFKLYQRYHSLGCELIEFFNYHNARTFCVQHGGVKTSNIKGQATSLSKTVLVWGDLMAKYIRELTPEKKVCIVGNPLHDKLTSKKDGLQSIRNPYILIATCLHSEYEMYGYPKATYTKYLTVLRDALADLPYKILIKMHPLDSSPTEYLDVLNKNVSVIKAESSPNIYSLVSCCDLVITRASTVAEEALLMNKKVLLFDVVEAGPANEYTTLSMYNNCKLVITSDYKRLANSIQELIDKESESEINSSIKIELSKFFMENKSVDNILQALKN